MEGLSLNDKHAEWKCPKCGSTEYKKKSLKIGGSLGWFNPLEPEAYIRSKCGYVELYAR
jgi:predicted nucleic-acid-binding Zn-ribbon protein